ncbi:MAG: DUF1576 domain-containing protein [Defluviitaleaceae bacterium]|nr:DUF1576 domain-containing protein [Defluviitaleaceae bacterium]
MSETAKKPVSPAMVWALLSAIHVAYGLVLTAISLDGVSFFDALWTYGLWSIINNPAILPLDHIAMGGIGPSFVNAGLVGFIILGGFKFAKLPISGPQMAVLGIVVGFSFMGKNILNILPILLGALLYSAFMKGKGGNLRDTYKNHITMAGFATCLAPVVTQPAFIPQFTDVAGQWLGVVIGVVFGLAIGFFINAMAVFIRKSHEGLNLYNIGWGAGLFAIALTAIYGAFGIENFVNSAPARGLGGQVVDIYGNYRQLSLPGAYNIEIYGYIIFLSLFFIVMGVLSGAKASDIKECLYLKAGDSKFINNFLAKYGHGKTYLAMGLLGVMILAVTLPLGININGPILAAVITVVGWGGFGKAVANAAAIGLGVLIAGMLRYFILPGHEQWAHYNLLEYLRTQPVIWTSALWGMCLSPMARFFGWKWAIPIGMLHFVLAATIANFHWGQQLYNNGLAAGFVCLIMIPLIRALDKKGRYGMEKVYPDPS